jgi:hypothetical protein
LIHINIEFQHFPSSPTSFFSEQSTIPAYPVKIPYKNGEFCRS